ncbi:MAG: DEAD/DEAH box helicase family protein [Burkholderiales bacterium]|nr:DEAD/DEAH box helicase family protein [Burkholderiales bacterium]
MTAVMQPDIIAAQSTAIEPEDFQATLIRNLTAALLRNPSPPCLLRAPTGSGKTFVISRVLAGVCAERDVLWFWFVPFVNLVQQTEDQLTSNCPGELAPVMLASGRNQEPAASAVLLSTAQAVAKATNRTKGYDADQDDDTRSLAALVARARNRGLQIGLVVDEAHIGLASGTEFGRFAAWLKPDYFIAATATPKDQALNDFVGQAGLSAVETFAVSRLDVVEARLNKRYIQAVVYQSPTGIQSVTDSKRTVLRQAWRRNLALRKSLLDAGVNVEPLLLVQVGNGDDAVNEARDSLMTLCKVPADTIGMHSAAEPDPALMSRIANDPTIRVLIFKQSAGTGFDAPRAFVLASTKPVNDPDFATQFIGRVMRVLSPIRARFPKGTPIPADLDTAYIYLANAEAQTGFQQSVAANAKVISELQGQTERLVTRETMSGALMITNRPTPQGQAFYDAPLPATELQAVDPSPNSQEPPVPPQAAMPLAPIGTQTGLDLSPPDQASDDEHVELDEMKPDAVAESQSRTALSTVDEVTTSIRNCGFQVYRLRQSLPALPRALLRELRPTLLNMSAISKAIATRVDLPESVRNMAVAVALSRAKGIERSTELTTGELTQREIAIVTDRVHLAADAREVLRALPQTEEADHRIIVDVLAQRLEPALQEKFDEASDAEQPDAKVLRQFARDAAFWVVIRQKDLLAEQLQEEIARQSQTVQSGPLPDAMLFSDGCALDSSTKNIYGVLPPTKSQIDEARFDLFIDSGVWLKERSIPLADGTAFLTSPYDESSKLNGFERRFAEALDRAPFVRWWHRNADRKSFGVAIVRADHRHYFYPDFVVCMQHATGDDALLRLIETKDNTKDAARKARHVPQAYGSVMFITQDGERIKIINKDGSLGDMVDTDDLVTVQDWLRKSRPTI